MGERALHHLLRAAPKGVHAQMVEQAQQLLMTCLFWLLRVGQPWSTMAAGENASLTSKQGSR